MNILGRRRSRTGNKSLLNKVFSSKRKSSRFSSSDIKNSERKENGSSDQSMPKATAILSSKSIPELAEADSFESIWTTRSDSSLEEVAPTTSESPKDGSNMEVHSNVNLEIQTSQSFEKELYEVLQETIERFPVDAKSSNIENEEKELEIDCSEDSIEDEGLSTPPSSTNAIFSGDLCDFSFESEDSAPVASERTASPPPKPTTVHRAQDIFRPKAERFHSPNHLCGGGVDDEQLQVKFTPSFEGIEMTNSFQQLETIEEEPSWYSPSMSFELDTHNLKQSAVSVTQGLKLMAVWILLLYNTCNIQLPLEKVTVPLTELVTPAIEELLVRRATNGPAVQKTFYNSHHTTMGAWLK